MFMALPNPSLNGVEHLDPGAFGAGGAIPAVKAGPNSMVQVKVFDRESENYAKSFKIWYLDYQQALRETYT